MLAVAGPVLLPVWVASLASSAPIVRMPANSCAVTARRVTLGWVTVMVPPFAMAAALCIANIRVRTLLALVRSEIAAP